MLGPTISDQFTENAGDKQLDNVVVRQQSPFLGHRTRWTVSTAGKAVESLTAAGTEDQWTRLEVGMSINIWPDVNLNLG